MSVVNETHTYANTMQQNKTKQNTKTGIITPDADSFIGGIVCEPNFRIYSVKLLYKGVEIAFYFLPATWCLNIQKRLILLVDDIF